jgi:hypothetical protein
MHQAVEAKEGGKRSEGAGAQPLVDPVFPPAWIKGLDQYTDHGRGHGRITAWITTCIAAA